MNDIKNLYGLEIFLGFKCNVRCEFCYQKHMKQDYINNFNKDKVISLIDNGYNQGKKFIIFSGGEPTLDSDLPFYIEYSKKLGFKHIRVHSNGFRFKDYNYFYDLYKKGLTGLTLSIHGFGKDHDNITKVKGSFKIISESLDNFKIINKEDNNFILDVNTVIYKGNYNKLLKLFLYIFKYNVVRYQINYSSSLDTFNIAEKNNLLIRYGYIVNDLRKILLFSLKKNKKLVIDSIPYCIIGEGFFSFIDNNIKNDRESFSVNGNNEQTYDETYNNIKPDKCINCNMFKKCRGIPYDYYQIYGDIDIKPFLGKKKY